ncbi:MAG: hypothetical protein LC624_00355, partial [Halobacteriales archaeon]|nr:hypothetical protein [Halobacteriales archaeon]
MRGAKSLLLLLLMTAPGVLSPLGEAQAPTDELGRVVDDAARSLDQAQQPGGPGPGGVELPVGAPDAGNVSVGDVPALDELTSAGPIRTLFYDGFEGAQGLGTKGWTSEALLGDTPWGLADARTGAVQRLDGSAFTPHGELGDVPVPVKDGRHAATVVNAKGLYDGRVDARLISPVLDLRGVEGASTQTEDAYDVITKDPTLSQPYKTALALWMGTLAPIGLGGSLQTVNLGSLTYVLVTPPTHLRRLPVPEGTVNVLPDIGYGKTVQNYVDALFYNPLQARYGAALVNLTFYEKYDFNPTFDRELGTTGLVRDDGAFLEARIVAPDGSVGPWEHLDGDTVLEAQVDKGTRVEPCPFVVAFGAFNLLNGRGINSEDSACAVSAMRIPASGIVEITQGSLAQDSSYDPISSFYQGRVKLHPIAECNAVGTVDCQSDVPAFVSHSGRGSLLKSHFTLNRYAGEQIQLAWRLRSAIGPNQPSETGWFLDAVKVEALMPARDPAVASVNQPRPGDLVPTTQVVRPKATIVNNGFLGVDALRVNFTVEERARDAAGDIAAAAGADAGALAAAVGARNPGGVQPPVGTIGAVKGAAQPARTLMRSSVLVPHLDAGQYVDVTSPEACTLCVPGRYQLRVEVSVDAASGGDLLSAPRRVPDGSAANDALTVPFDVRDVAEARIRLTTDADQVLTDLNEPKTFHILATNLGNRDLEGNVELNATPVDPTTLEPVAGAPAYNAGTLVLGPGALPAGKLRTSYGADRDTFAGNATWEPRGLPPGVYRVTAALRVTPAPAALPVDFLNTYIRTTPTAYVQTGFEDPGTGSVDGFGPDHLERAGLTHQGWARIDPCAARDQGNCPATPPTAKGAVSTNHTWEGTGNDASLADLGALALLRGASAGVANGGVNVATVHVEGDQLQACISTAACTQLPYGTVEQNLALGAGQEYPAHSYLNDYYLTTTVDLTGCGTGCAPLLSFEQTANFSWNGGVEAVPLPTDGLPLALGIPGVVQQVSADQQFENRSRGLIEVTILDDDLPPALVTGSHLHPGLGTGAVESACAAAQVACETLSTACPGDVFDQLPDGQTPLTSLPATPVTPVSRLLGEQTQFNPRCVMPFVQHPGQVSAVLAAFTKPLPEFQRVANVNLADYAGHRIALTFHFQTTVGRLQGQPDPMVQPCMLGIGSGTTEGAPCLGHPLDRWVVDNIRLRGAGEGSFFDTVGDAVPGIALNANWTRWASFRTMREATDADATLDPSCMQGLHAADAKDPAAFVSGLRAPEFSAYCLDAEGTQLHGLVVSLDGRGWERHEYALAPTLEGTTSSAPNAQPVGPGNPYPDAWFLDATAGFNAPGRVDLAHRYAMRWGGPKDSVYPTEDLYGIASTPALDLTRTSSPFLAFQNQYDFHRRQTNDVDDTDPTAYDGGALFLARYACTVGDCTDHPEALQFDRRGELTPDGGYPGKVSVAFADNLATIVGVDWGASSNSQGTPEANNAFTRQSGGGADPQWVRVGAALATAFPSLCLKSVRTVDGRESIRSFQLHPAAANLTSADWEALSACPDAVAAKSFADTAAGGSSPWFRADAHTLVFNETGTTYTDITTFTQDPGSRYAVEFHAVNAHNAGTLDEGLGWSVDDLRLGEQTLANDVGVSRFVVPGGKLVGPGEEIQVRVNVTNYGLFTQRGVKVHFNVTQQGVQVFPDPSQGDSVVQSVAGSVPGLRDPSPKNVTVAFDTAWVPASQGVFVINAWTELTGEVVNGLLIPLLDEDASNDQFTQQVEVREVHSVRLLRADEMPDAQVVLPLVATPDEARSIRLGLENTGTVSEGLALGPERAVSLRLVVTDESGTEVLRRDLAVDRITAGQQATADFGLQAWKPSQSGLYTLRFTLAMASDLTPGDNERVVKVLVLTQLIPKPGQSWADLFAAQGSGWSDGTRLNFDAGQGWSFGSGKQYQPDQDGSLVLKVPVDLTTFRSAVLAVKHSYDLELGYDGGLVEVSPDGQTWIPVEPVGGYPAPLTTASPVVTDPDQRQDAFTGQSGGVVDSFFPLGTVNITRTDLIALLRDTFEPDEPAVLGQRVNSTLGQWYEVRTNVTVPAGRAWWTNRTLVNSGAITRAVGENLREDAANYLKETGPALEPGDGNAYEGTKVLRTAQPFTVPSVNGTLVIEYQEWRSLGIAHRGNQQEIHVPSAAEADLQVVDPEDGTLVDQLVVLPRAATSLSPYADNQMGWTERSVVLPAPSVEGLRGQPLRLAFTVSLANTNNAGSVHAADSPGDFGGGRPEDTDLQSPALGWAMAAPRVSLITTQVECAKATTEGLAHARSQPGFFAPRFEDGRCILFEDRGLEPGAQGYAGTDPATARWEGAWSTTLSRAPRNSEIRRTATSEDGVDPDGLADAAQAALRDGGWRIVDKVGLLSDAHVWDTRSVAPPASGHGLVALAQGQGQDARLITPLNLRAASGEVQLSLNQSFKFTAIEQKTGEPLTGGLAGGRVEVSRDGGLTWEPVAPTVPAPDPLSYTTNLAGVHFLRTFTQGSPPENLLCRRPASPGCVDPSDPFAAVGRWTPQGTQAFNLDPARSAATPFAGVERDPEGDSPYGYGSMAFTGSTCARKGFEEKLDDPCIGREDWQGVTFDLTPYAGQDVLLAFHAWFPTHRFVGAPHIGTDGDPVFMPQDFWRIDDATVQARVLDGRPLYVRLHGFSDGTGERYGWDVLNVSLLGDQHLANLGVRILDPQPGGPLFGQNATVTAVVQNKGLLPVSASGVLLAEQVGLPQLLSGGFEDWNFTTAQGCTPSLCVDAIGNWTLNNLNTTRSDGTSEGWFVDWGAISGKAPTGPVEGSSAFGFVGAGTATSQFDLRQQLTIPPGSWLLRGRYEVSKDAAQRLDGGVELRLLDAATAGTAQELPLDNDPALAGLQLAGSSHVQLDFPTTLQAAVVGGVGQTFTGSGRHQVAFDMSPVENISTLHVVVSVNFTGSSLHLSSDTVDASLVAPDGTWSTFRNATIGTTVEQPCVALPTGATQCVGTPGAGVTGRICAPSQVPPPQPCVSGPTRLVFNFTAPRVAQNTTLCPNPGSTPPRDSPEAAWADMPPPCVFPSGPWTVIVTLNTTTPVEDSSSYTIEAAAEATTYA